MAENIFLYFFLSFDRPTKFETENDPTIRMLNLEKILNSFLKALSSLKTFPLRCFDASFE
jgi:hypothetical protein